MDLFASRGAIACRESLYGAFVATRRACDWPFGKLVDILTTRHKSLVTGCGSRERGEARRAMQRRSLEFAEVPGFLFEGLERDRL